MFTFILLCIFSMPYIVSGNTVNSNFYYSENRGWKFIFFCSENRMHQRLWSRKKELIWSRKIIYFMVELIIELSQCDYLLFEFIDLFIILFKFNKFIQIKNKLYIGFTFCSLNYCSQIFNNKICLADYFKEIKKKHYR